ncbi:hypothetical protein OCGS_1145 [Oceaniovalibus guishaninsula JLT2003]|uniref:Uncharacterized protein n=1 Tax=Oceaniovalibus guishaninsula JLT2003 TaxID=1231392 RepID=K2HDZ8_9RHOB|nr:choice-of-anchor E domain-containing protein [Oceaniovalibus guishaninsula]EKE44762.1 hypothetical protein OCGS_1145 [Oceaniovalibus guishaninsula JLT2003]
MNKTQLAIPAACAALALLAGQAGAATLVLNGAPFGASGTISDGNFDIEDDTRLSFDKFDPSLGKLTGVTLDYSLSTDLTGTFDYAGDGGSWNANTNVNLGWDAGGFGDGDGDGDGNGRPGGGSDSVDIAAGISGTASASDLSNFLGSGQTDVFVKYVFGGGGGPGAFDLTYTADSSVVLTYTYDADGDGGNGNGNGDGNGGTPPVVPLPAGLPLLLGGFGALAFLRRRRG